MNKLTKILGAVALSTAALSASKAEAHHPRIYMPVVPVPVYHLHHRPVVPLIVVAPAPAYIGLRSRPLRPWLVKPVPVVPYHGHMHFHW